MPCSATVLEKLPRLKASFPQESSHDGGIQRPRKALFSTEMGQPCGLRNPSLRTCLFAAHISEPRSWSDRKPLSAHFSLSRTARAQSGPKEERVEPANRQNLIISHRPVRSLIQSPAGPLFPVRWVQSNHAVAEIRTCEPPVSAATFQSPNGGDASALFCSNFSQPAAAVLNSGPDERILGVDRRNRKTQQTVVVPTNGRF